MAINTTYGFSAKQVVDRISNYIGNDDATFLQYVQETINLAQFRYCGSFDWSFLNKTSLELTTVNGTTEYELDITSVGFNVPADYVNSIIEKTQGRSLAKVGLQQIRRLDPEEDDGGPDDTPSHWAPVGEQRIYIYPPQMKAVTLTIDAKVLPTPVTNFTSEDPAADVAARFTIPYKYQESFIELVLAMVLDRENDDRASVKMQSARAMMTEDIRADQANLGGSIGPRMQHWHETAPDGASDQLNSIAWVHASDD